MSKPLATNLGIGSLIDVDVAGTLSGRIKATLGFKTDAADHRIRIGDFDNVNGMVDARLDGGLSFHPKLTARMPIVGEIKWDAEYDATYDKDGFKQRFKLNDPTEDIGQLIQNSYRSIVGAFKLFGGVDLTKSLPGVGENLASVLKLPSILTGGGLGLGGPNFQIDVSLANIRALISGKHVDLVKYWSSGEDKYRVNFDVPIAAAVIPIGPIPVDLEASFSTYAEGSWSYYAGFGIDTAGFYIDPATNFKASATVGAALSASAGVLGLAKVKATAGADGTLEFKVRLEDPNPADGRIYLDELLGDRATSLGNALFNVIDVSIEGRARSYWKVVAKSFFGKKKWGKEYPLASFDVQLSESNRSAQANPTSQRAVTKRTPGGNTAAISSSLLRACLKTPFKQVV